MAGELRRHHKTNSGKKKSFKLCRALVAAQIIIIAHTLHAGRGIIKTDRFFKMDSGGHDTAGKLEGEGGQNEDFHFHNEAPFSSGYVLIMPRIL